MVAPYMPVRRGQIAGMRVRRNWLGRAILQVRFKQTHRKHPLSDEWVNAGLTKWIDANMNDTDECAAVMVCLNTLSKDMEKHV